MVLYKSIMYDGHSVSETSWAEHWKSSKVFFDNLEYSNTEKLTLYKSANDSIMGRYQIQLFKMPWDNYYNQSRYLLWYKDFGNEAWLRVGGYVENDLHHLFNFLRKQNFNTRKLRAMLKEWEENDDLFHQAQLECIFDGYLKNKTKADCFKSVFYIIANQVTVGFDPLTEKQLNSGFSKLPSYGYFLPYR